MQIVEHFPSNGNETMFIYTMSMRIRKFRSKYIYGSWIQQKKKKKIKILSLLPSGFRLNHRAFYAVLMPLHMFYITLRLFMMNTIVFKMYYTVERGKYLFFG